MTSIAMPSTLQGSVQDQIHAATPTPAPTRAHRLHNLRPVGGFSTRDGQVVRNDLIWRSAAPLSERESGSRAIVDLGVSTVVDLRDVGERDRTPGAWAHDELTVHALPVFDDELHSITFDELSDLYSLMVTSYAPRIALAFSAVATNASGGVLFHCTAGKDRTGMLGAMVLEVLGVDRVETLADYSRSQELLGDDYLDDLFAGVDVSTLPGLAAHRATMSPPELLAAALERIDREHGGAAEFLLAHGVTQEEIDELRDALLVG